MRLECVVDATKMVFFSLTSRGFFMRVGPLSKILCAMLLVTASLAANRAAHAAEDLAGNAREAGAQGAVSEVHGITAYTNGVIQHTRTFTFNKDVKDFPVVIKTKNDPRDISFVKQSIFFAGRGGASLSKFLHDFQLAQGETLTIDADNPVESILKQTKGAHVVVKKAEDKSPVTSGVLMGVSTLDASADKNGRTRKFVEINTETGLRQVPLTAEITVEFLDESLQAKVANALKQSFRAIDKEAAELEFSIDGVKGSTFVVLYFEPGAAPKISYRLKESGASGAKGGPIEMQTFVHVTNATKQDWKDVKFRYVNGGFNAFASDIAQNRYPEFEFVQLVDNRAQGDVQSYSIARSASRGLMPQGAPSEADAAPGGAGLESPASAEAAVARPSAFASDSAGDFSYYTTAKPLTIASGESLDIPVDTQILPDAKKVLVYQPRNGNKIFSGIKLKNSLGKTLAKGPLTLYHGDELVGGQHVLKGLAPDEERIATFAPERRVTGRSVIGEQHSVRAAVKIADGAMAFTNRSTLKTVYTVTNPTNEEFLLRIDHAGYLGPKSTFTCVERPAAIEVADKNVNACCVQVELKPGEVLTLTVAEQNIRDVKIVISEDNPSVYDQFRSYVVDAAQPFTASESLQACIDTAKRLGDARRELGEAQIRLEGLKSRAEEARKSSAADPTQNVYREKLLLYSNEIDTLVDSTLVNLRSEIDRLQVDLRKKLSTLSFSWSE